MKLCVQHLTLTALLLPVWMLFAAPTPEASPANTTTNNALITMRDPFWPVGFHPTPKSEKQDKEKEKESRIHERLSWPKLELRGVSQTSQGNFICIIEGIGIVEPGDVISMEHNGLIYRWKINTISNSGISRTRLNVHERMSTLHKSK